jgi:hypothetical protein
MPSPISMLDQSAMSTVASSHQSALPVHSKRVVGGGLLTKKIDIRKGFDPRKPNDNSRRSNTRHTQNPNNRDLSLAAHMQLADHENRQNANCEITQRRKRTIHVRHGDDDLDVDALALYGGVQRGLRPEEGDGLALQQHDEHEGEAGDGCQRDDAVQNPDVELFDGDAQQEDADGDFAGDAGPAVGYFAEPPVLFLVNFGLFVGG